jgi:molybdopterin-guanine dinucleotide biosynthesis protein A
MPHPLIIDGGILAGGLANRMQGKDKGLQLFKNMPMASWVYQALSPHVRNVIINCNRNQTEYAAISGHISSDTISGFPGPLAGIVSVMEASDADYFLISPCDTPLLKQDYAVKMLQFLHAQYSHNSNNPILFAIQVGEKQQPLHMCISREYKNSLKNYLEKDEHRVMKWMKHNNALWLDFPTQTDSFRNFNTLEEVNAY